ncbi:MAG: D-sedoheptulose 7-phosphate isomerase [Bacteroidetes bacterium]|jgi:D-sedoheptulose 7-phosphate isomerase|nr:D-sedoheptulose 7-phosphate isomerase [Bacteroidota bacterium]MDF1864672.1 D-sedoheptulose 7-phosphate isomerase [Saprospiraceae bacterium]
MTKIQAIILQSISIKNTILSDLEFIGLTQKSADLIIETLKNDGKTLFCGNGGSAADAQHLACELSGRFYLDRAPLFAEALHSNSSFMTAVANDYGYSQVFARGVKAMGREGDILVALSTSGNSKNIIEAIVAAKECNMKVIGMTGENGGKMKDLCDVILKIPSEDTPRIQEAHIMVGHIICELVETAIFGSED